jgi:hypothetical protein
MRRREWRIVSLSTRVLQLPETMDIDEFWNIVERVHAASPDDMKNKCRLLADELRRLFAAPGSHLILMKTITGLPRFNWKQYPRQN